MLKKMLIVIVVLMSFLCGYAYLIKQSDVSPQSVFQNKGDEIKKTFQEPIVKEKEMPALLKEINERSMMLKTFICDNVEIKVWQDNKRYRLTGNIHYGKPDNFHMEIFSVLGKEVDIGSNDKEFWYWSKRDKNPALYWAAHEDFEKTRLKTPFNPILMRSSLGQELLSMKDARIVDGAKKMMVVYPQQSASGQPILFTVFIDKERKQVDGFVVTNLDGKYLASCDIQERSGNLPKVVLYTWYEENRVMLMTFNRPATNIGIQKNEWTMPNYSPKINMAER